MKTEQLQHYSKRLGAKEFDPVDASSIQFPVKGIVVGGSTHRLMINMAVAYNPENENEAKTLWVPFLVHSGSPWTFMSKRSIEALGVKPIRETTFCIHGFDDIFVNISPPASHFADVNILGGDFFHQTSILPLHLYHKRAFYFFKNEQMLKEFSIHL
jgi:hypothetical protein